MNSTNSLSPEPLWNLNNDSTTNSSDKAMENFGCRGDRSVLQNYTLLLVLCATNDYLNVAHALMYIQGGLGALSGLYFMAAMPHSLPATARLWLSWLSGCDLLCLLFYGFYLVVTRTSLIHVHFLYEMFGYVLKFLVFTESVGVCMLLGFSVERVAVLQWPLRTRHCLTTRKVWMAISIAVLYSLVLVALFVVATWTEMNGFPALQLYTLLDFGVNKVLLAVGLLTCTVMIVRCLRLSAGNNALLAPSTPVDSSSARTPLFFDKSSSPPGFNSNATNKCSTPQPSSPPPPVLNHQQSQQKIVQKRRQRESNLLAWRLIWTNLLFVVMAVPVALVVTIMAAELPRTMPKKYGGSGSDEHVESSLLTSNYMKVMISIFRPLLYYNNALNWLPLYLSNARFRAFFVSGTMRQCIQRQLRHINARFSCCCQSHGGGRSRAGDHYAGPHSVRRFTVDNTEPMSNFDDVKDDEVQTNSFMRGTERSYVTQVIIS